MSSEQKQQGQLDINLLRPLDVLGMSNFLLLLASRWFLNTGCIATNIVYPSNEPQSAQEWIIDYFGIAKANLAAHKQECANHDQHVLEPISSFTNLPPRALCCLNYAHALLEYTKQSFAVSKFCATHQLNLEHVDAAARKHAEHVKVAFQPDATRQPAQRASSAANPPQCASSGSVATSAANLPQPVCVL